MFQGLCIDRKRWLQLGMPKNDRVSAWVLVTFGVGESIKTCAWRIKPYPAQHAASPAAASAIERDLIRSY